MIKPGSRDPILIEWGFVEWWPAGLVSDYDIVFELESECAIEGAVDEVG